MKATLPRRSAVILAAGMSKRFRSEIPKALHPLCGKPMILHILDKLGSLQIDEVVVVVGHGAEKVTAALEGRGLVFVEQAEKKGTGHALMTAVPALENQSGSILVLYGDTPLIGEDTLRKLIELREEEALDAALVTCETSSPTGYGRILRDSDGELVEIIEERDATPAQKLIREVNPGFYCFKADSLIRALPQLSCDNAQGEYYLTDVPTLIRRFGGRVGTLQADAAETVGINDRVQFSEVEKSIRRQINRKWMQEGVTFLDPDSTWIDQDVQIGTDTTIYPGVVIEGQSRIGRNCTLLPGAHLHNAVLGEGVRVENGSVIRDSEVGNGSTVGPYAHLRQGARIGASVRIGNFVEIKKSTLGDGTKAAHLTYVGDAEIGKNVNLGAGTITCNYDGLTKNKTIIGDGAFIGSDCQLIAPVTIGSGAYVAAGSSITEDVPSESLAIARSRQLNKPGWAKQRKKSRK